MRTTKTNGEARNIDKICVTTEGLQDLLDCGRPSAVEVGTLAKSKSGNRSACFVECFKGSVIY